jgi:hypothetical protein
MISPRRIDAAAGLTTNVMSVCQPLIVRRGRANGSGST